MELDTADEEPGEPFFDELPAHDWAAQLGDLTVCSVTELRADRVVELELRLTFAVDAGGWPAQPRC